MSLLQNSNAIPTGVTGYNLTDSVRFRSSASAYLTRTPSTSGNRKTWTWSCWTKRGSKLAGTNMIFSAGNATSDRFWFSFDANDKIVIRHTVSSTNTDLTTNAVFRDPSAWYHIVLVFDTTQATSSNRVKLYVNGVQQSLTGSYVAQNLDTYVNDSTKTHAIGTDAWTLGTLDYDGYMTEIHFVDGQALDPTDFGETDETSGVWKPKRYTGTYGTNGFYLNMSTSGSTVTDQSGNGNNWTANNMNLTTSTATTYDKMTDVPTLTDEDTGNFATLNPLDSYSAGLSEANLKFANGSGVAYQSWSSIVNPDITTYKFYCEVKVDAGYGIGIAPDTKSGTNTTTRTGVLAYYSNGNKFNDTSSSAYGATFTTNDIIGIAMGNGQVEFFKNGVSQGVAFSSLTGAWKFGVWAVGATGIGCSFNFGQRPFAYTPPTGFKKLNTYNLPDSSIVDGSQYFNTVLYSGTGSSNTIDTSMYNDFTWLKMRSSSSSHYLWDSIRGFSNTKALDSRTNGAEGHNSAYYTVSRKGDNQGFIINDVSPGNEVNSSGNTYVAWNWRANDGSSGVTNTNGSVTSTVSANTTAGFSISTHTNPSGTYSWGHGLSSAPEIIILKSRNAAENWVVWHKDLATPPTTTATYLNLTYGTSNSGSNWLQTVNNSIIQVTAGQFHTQSTYVAYCWHSVEGFSKFGKYTGNGSTDGPFIYTGFRPAFLLLKRTDSSTAGYWVLHDSKRDDYNPADKELFPNDSIAEYEVSTREIDLLSNGFKFRDLEYCNYSSAQYIYMAFAENPFKNSLAR